MFYLAFMNARLADAQFQLSSVDAHSARNRLQFHREKNILLGRQRSLTSDFIGE